MTNEQVIAVLKNMIRSNNEHGKTLLCIGEVQAIYMAIEALSNNKKQTDSLIRTSTDSVSATDVIYRADAIDAFTSKYSSLDFMEDGVIELYVETIENLPSAQQWIPVEERLPEDGVYVLICDGKHFKDYDCKNGAYSQIAVGWTEHGEFRCWDDRTHMSKVIAWMELPEPYKEGDNNET